MASAGLRLLHVVVRHLKWIGIRLLSVHCAMLFYLMALCGVLANLSGTNKERVNQVSQPLVLRVLAVFYRLRSGSRTTADRGEVWYGDFDEQLKSTGSQEPVPPGETAITSGSAFIIEGIGRTISEAHEGLLDTIRHFLSIALAVV